MDCGVVIIDVGIRQRNRLSRPRDGGPIPFGQEWMVTILDWDGDRLDQEWHPAMVP
jgi:hypothetical protein